MLTMKYFSLRKLALSLARNNINPIDKAQEHSMSIRANCLTWENAKCALSNTKEWCKVETAELPLMSWALMAALRQLLFAHPVSYR